MKTKKCRLCKKVKSVDEFYKHKTTKDGYLPECISCRKDINKKYYKENPHYIKLEIIQPRKRKNKTENFNEYKKERYNKIVNEYNLFINDKINSILQKGFERYQSKHKILFISIDFKYKYLIDINKDDTYYHQELLKALNKELRKEYIMRDFLKKNKI